MSTVAAMRRKSSLPEGTACSRRRSILSALLALTLLPAVPSVWRFRSSDDVVVRNGWVLAKGD